MVVLRSFIAGIASLGMLAASTAGYAGVIKPASLGSGISCSDTAAFTLRTDCVGEVTDPKNDVGSSPNRLIDYLNGYTDGTDTWYIGSNDGSDPWGTVGAWKGISNELDADGGLIPGTSNDGLFSVTDDNNDRLDGGWTFDVSGLTGKVIDYLVVNVKDGNGWSSYYYDLVAFNYTTFSDTWDTLGISSGNIRNGNQKAGPAVSHMYAAYILGDDDDGEPPSQIPAPGTLVLLSAPLIGLGAWRHRRC